MSASSVSSSSVTPLSRLSSGLNISWKKSLRVYTRYNISELLMGSTSDRENQFATHQIGMGSFIDHKSQRESILVLHKITPKLQEEISSDRLSRILDFIEKYWNVLDSIKLAGGGLVDRSEGEGKPLLERTLYVSDQGVVLINCKKRPKGVKNASKIVGKGTFKTITLAIIYNPSPGVSRLKALGITKLEDPSKSTDENLIVRAGAVKEALYGMSIKHKNIVPIDFEVYYTGSSKKDVLKKELPVLKQGLYMPYYESGDLFELMNVFCGDMNFFNVDRVESLFSSILKGLDYIHQHGYTHFDLKPENIMLEIEENSNPVSIVPIIGDFGMMKKVGTTDYVTNPQGSPEYVAPELWELVDARGGLSKRIRSYKEKKITPKCDIYALGLIFGTIVGLPKPEQNLRTCVWNEYYRDMIEPRQDSLHYLVWKMTRTNPDERITAADALTLLENIVAKLKANSTSRRDRVSSQDPIEEGSQKKRRVL